MYQLPDRRVCRPGIFRADHHRGLSGKSLIKGLIAGIVGVILSFVGTDPIWGDLRFTFGNINLMTGVSTIPAMIGLYSIPQIIISCTGKEEIRIWTPGN